MENQELYFNQLSSFFRDNGLNPDPYQLERLSMYACLVVEKNQAVNLISRKDTASVVENHVFISAFISHFIPEKCTRFLDIGTGGGFPGIPLAIMRPTIKGVMVDSTAKKIDAVQEFLSRLKLINASAVNSRVEAPEFTEKYAGCFDLIVSRATVPLAMLLRYALPVIKEKTVLASLKGGDLTEEIRAAELKYKAHIKKLTVFEMNYKPTNVRNEKEKKLILLELTK
ncbi:MAG: 16S rRNA (guanine(527)-N(7))-methyltransferase RsmG [Syntrophomonadaceae bacterium]